MIGGLKLRVGDQLFDASIETRLRRMRERLSSSGRAAMKSRTESIIEDKG
jgi:hypothetical protein